MITHSVCDGTYRTLCQFKDALARLDTILFSNLSLQKRIIIHEVGHALGLHHEQTRPDRDNYVTIMSRNIAPHLLYNFQRYTWRTIENYNVPYDYYSIMHYGKTVSVLDFVVVVVVLLLLPLPLLPFYLRSFHISDQS